MSESRSKPLLAGIAVTAACLGLSLLGDLLWAWPWRTGMLILLAIMLMSIGSLAVIERDHPPTWGGGFWSVYTEMSGREAAGGGLSEMTGPEGRIHSRLLLVAIVPAASLIVLLLSALV